LSKFRPDCVVVSRRCPHRLRPPPCRTKFILRIFPKLFSNSSLWIYGFPCAEVWKIPALCDRIGCLIYEAILTSDLGLNPSNDGTIIRLPIPPLTGDRRKEFTKQGHDQGEKTKIAVRNQRRDMNDMVKELQKNGEITEDDLKRALTKIQDATDDCMKKIDAAVSEKEKEIMEI
jgi:hypothetical protein